MSTSERWRHRRPSQVQVSQPLAQYLAGGGGMEGPVGVALGGGTVPL